MPEINNRERIENVTNNLVNITNTVNNLPNYLNTSDANAIASDLLINKTAYVNSIKITGTMNNYGDVNIDPTTSSQLYNGGYYNSININAVTANIDPNITANNIANGINILGIVGTFEGGTNTMDATATENDIAFGLTAYANNTKITGNVDVLNIDNLLTVDSSNSIYINGNNVEFSYLWNQGRKIVDNGFRLNTSIISNNLANAININENILAVGSNILGVNGTYTADANALNNQILENYTAYVNGEKIVGSFVPVMTDNEYSDCLNITNNILL